MQSDKTYDVLQSTNIEGGPEAVSSTAKAGALASCPTGSPSSLNRLPHCDDEGMDSEYGSWVKAYRKTVDWPLFRMPKVAHLWEYIRLKATYKPFTAVVRTTTIDLSPGQMIFGRFVASEETGLSEQEIRTSLRILQQHSCIVVKSTKQFSIITICNWESYQNTETQANQRSTNDQPTANQQPTNSQPRTRSIKKIKEDKEGKEVSDACASSSSPSAQPDQKPRPRNPHWDAVVSVYGLSYETKTLATRVGKLARDFKALHPDGESIESEIRTRRGRMVSSWGSDKETPEALVKHWQKFAQATLPMDASSQQAITMRAIHQANEQAARERSERAMA